MMDRSELQRPATAMATDQPARPARRRWLGLLALPGVSALAGVLDDAPGANTQFLPVGEAFKVRWLWQEGRAIGEYVVAPGYYLYRDRLHFELQTPAQGSIREVKLPEGEPHEDPYSGSQVIYPRSIRVELDFALPAAYQGPIVLKTVWQGCASAGLCYPPQRRSFELRS